MPLIIVGLSVKFDVSVVFLGFVQEREVGGRSVLIVRFRGFRSSVLGSDELLLRCVFALVGWFLNVFLGRVQFRGSVLFCSAES